MKTEFWLKIGAKRQRPHYPLKRTDLSVRSAKPPCDAHEVAIKMDLDIPDALFEKPTLQASIEVPEQQTAPAIDVQVMDGLAQRLSEEFGLKIRLELGE
jgi:hypothetical protein